jgi:hypothetical protein
MGDRKGETGSEITAAQNLALQTVYCATKVLKIEREKECNLRQH